MVDWTKPIEAVHKYDGCAIAANLKPGGSPGHRYVTWENEDAVHTAIFHDTGVVHSAYVPEWFIRNVAERPAWRTSAEQLDRMDALLVRIVTAAGASNHLPISDEWAVITEAKAIIAAREPVDPRFNKVLAVLQQNERWLMQEDSARRFVRDVLAALDK